MLWVCKRLLHLQPANGEAISSLQGRVLRGGCSLKVVFWEGGKKEKFFFEKSCRNEKQLYICTRLGKHLREKRSEDSDVGSLFKEFIEILWR